MKTLKTLFRNFCLFTIPLFPIIASAQSAADFFKDQNGFFFFMGINHNMTHLVWDEIKDGSMQGYALERSEDGITYSPIASCMAAHSLPDIMGLSASRQDEINSNPFERLLYTTETGSGRFIYNQSVTDAMLSSNQQWYYRIKFIRAGGNITYSGIRSFDSYRQYRKGVDNTHVNNATGKEQHAHDLKIAGSALETIYGNQKNSPLPTPQSCPAVQTPPSGACTTGVVKLNIPCPSGGNTCGTYTEKEYLFAGINCMGTCCCNIDCFPSSYDDCCVHKCYEYAQCSCTPWLCCNSSNTQWIITQVNAGVPPAVTVSSSAACASSSSATANVSGGTAPFTYLWSPGGGTTQIISNITPGSYTVTVTAANGCSSTAAGMVVPAYPSPTANFASNDVCLGQTNIFTDKSFFLSGTITGWNWNFGDGNASALPNPVHTYTSTGTFTATLVVTSSPNGCTGMMVDTIQVYPLPVALFSADSVCGGAPTTFSDLSSIIPSDSITGWNWNFGDNTSSSLQNPTHTYTSGGNYNVTLTLTSSNNCTNSVTALAVVHPVVVANFGATNVGETVTFSDLSAGVPVWWYWNFGDGNSSALQNPIHTYSDTGSYLVTLIAISQYGCVDTVQQIVELKDFNFYMPNSFTPNEDGKNDLFFGKGTGITEYELSIFDRWGNLVFSCTVLNELPQSAPCCWDGKMKGNYIQQDVYVWKVRLKNVFNKELKYTGTVTVNK